MTGKEVIGMNRKGLPGRNMLLMMGAILILLGVLLLVSPAAVGGAVVRMVALVLVVTGVVQRLAVDDGDLVKARQVLSEVDPA